MKTLAEYSEDVKLAVLNHDAALAKFDIVSRAMDAANADPARIVGAALFMWFDAAADEETAARRGIWDAYKAHMDARDAAACRT